MIHDCDGAVFASSPPIMKVIPLSEDGMGSVPAAKMNELVGAHAALKADDLLRLRSLSGPFHK